MVSGRQGLGPESAFRQPVGINAAEPFGDGAMTGLARRTTAVTPTASQREEDHKFKAVEPKAPADVAPRHLRRAVDSWGWVAPKFT